MVIIFKYMYIKATTGGLFNGKQNHRELIDRYSREGWRFVTAIPTESNGHGVIFSFDLVFEKEENQ